MTTCLDLIEETRRHVFSGQREQINRLTNTINSSVTSLVVDFDLGPLQKGTYISIDLEIMYVWDVAPASKTVTVQRAQLGSTAASHTSGVLVYVNSKFPAFSIFQELNHDLADLCAPGQGLYQVVTTEITYNAAVSGYDLGVTTGVDFIDVLSVFSNQPGPSQDWYPIDSYRVDPNANTTDFPSGVSITLRQAGWSGLALRVVYSAGFAPFTAVTDNVTVTGLPTSCSDLPALGAAMRLTGVREIKRNFDESQGDTRRASEVPPNAQLAGYQALARERARRIKSESQRLVQNYPMRRKLPA